MWRIPTVANDDALPRAPSGAAPTSTDQRADLVVQHPFAHDPAIHADGQQLAMAASRAAAARRRSRPGALTDRLATAGRRTESWRPPIASSTCCRSSTSAHRRRESYGITGEVVAISFSRHPGNGSRRQHVRSAADIESVADVVSAADVHLERAQAGIVRQHRPLALNRSTIEDQRTRPSPGPLLTSCMVAQCVCVRPFSGVAAYGNTLL